MNLKYNSVQEIEGYYENRNRHVHILQVGDKACTYLPNLLSKYLTVSNVLYTYTWCNHAQDNLFPRDIETNIKIYNTTDPYHIALNIPFKNKTEQVYIIWAYDIEKYDMFIKTFKQLYNNHAFIQKRTTVLFPFLSKNGGSIKIRTSKEKLLKSHKNYMIKNWEYSYAHDMLATMYAYNFITTNIYTWPMLYTDIGGDGVSNFKINQEMYQIVMHSTYVSNMINNRNI